MTGTSGLSLVLVAALVAACGVTPVASTTPPPSQSSARATAQTSESPAGATAEASVAAPVATPEGATPESRPSPTGARLAADTVAVVAIDGLRLRTEPSTSAGELGRLVRNAEAFVISGPVAADGYQWYEVAGLGVPPYGGCEGPYPEGLLVCPVWYGWAAGGGPTGEEWLQPSDQPCPDPPAAVADLIPPPPLRWLSCLGDSAFTMRAYVPEHSALGIGCTTWPGFVPAWLGACQFVFLADADTADPYLYRVHVDPELGRACTEGVNCALAGLEGQWVLVTAHFNDAAAATCQSGAAEDAPPGWREKSAAELVLMCRQTLVVTHLQPVGS